MRRVACSITVLAGLFALSACGGGGSGAAKGPSISVETLQAAAQNSQAATSTSYEMTIELEVDGESVTIQAQGVGSADGRTLQMTMDVGGFGSIEARVVDGTFYYDFSALPGAATELPAGKHWLAIGLDDFAAHGVDLEQLLEQAEQNTANQGLEYLQGVDGEVVEVGDEVVNGVPTTHYRATISYGKVVDQFADAYSEELRAELRELGDVPVDLWVDAQERVVKARYEMPGQAFGAEGGVVMTMEITGFDVPLNVVAPPADQVLDISDLDDLGFQPEPLAA